MPLTRHLYREDEVCAALQWCLLRGRATDTAFWALELLDSGLVEQLERAVEQVWRFAFGIVALGWWRAWCQAVGGDAVDADALLELLVGLARTRARDCSVYALGTLSVGAEVGRVWACPRLAVYEDWTPLEAFAARALWQGKARTAWTALHAIPLERRRGILDAVAVAKHGADVLARSWDPVLACAVVLARPEVVRTGGAPWVARPMPPEVTAALEDWRLSTGRRARRALSIPVDCLHWLTARGRICVYTSNERELIGPMERPGKLWGSDYWDLAAEEMGGWLAVRDDDTARETFYDTYFPDDRPDEWSKAERAKSHGGGVLQRGAAPDVGKWLRNWLLRVGCALLWGGAVASPAVEGWDSLLRRDWLGDVPDAACWCLVPVEKVVFEVV